jgi:N-acetylglucosamine kinase
MITCFDIGGSAIKGAAAASSSEIVAIDRVPTPLDDFESFVQAIKSIVGHSPARPDRAISIAITGVVDPDSLIIKCANIPCVDGRPLAADLSARLGRPVLIANDADCFALAEAVEGAGQRHRVVFGAILGTGVGGGLVIDGRVINGAGGFAGEWGHGPAAATMAGVPPVPIPRFACGCGQFGCVDTIGGARGMERLHQHLHGTSPCSAAIIADWLAGDAAASRTIDCYVDLVASPLALTVNIVGAGIVPVGGGLSNVPQLIARIDDQVRKRILRHVGTPLVVPGKLGVESGLIGAAIIGLNGESP